ncbi:NAD(P)-dependent oxidoreductase [Herbaspirillum lusitanum]|jgi:4-hydroxybutyrate dehydrogenase/sulfolactaldehyde 3-reductase
MSQQAASLKVGFIGLGRMGLGMASNLQRKGFRLTVYDVNRDAVAALVKLGAQPASSVAEASRGNDIVVTMLPNSAIVLDVVGGADGVLASIAAGALVMDMSTVEPEVTDRLAATALAQGKSLVDAPVGRLASHADRGESLFMVGGTAADFQRVNPLLEAMGSTIHHCGEVGSGTRTKLVNNYLAVVSCQLNAEALTLSQRFGLSLEKTLDVIYGTTATNGQLKIAWPDKVLKGDIAPGFTIDLAHKDLTLIVNAANSAKSPMPIGAAAKEAFSTARARGFGGNDFSAMVDVLCDLSHTEKPRLKN